MHHRYRFRQTFMHSSYLHVWKAHSFCHWCLSGTSKNVQSNFPIWLHVGKHTFLLSSLHVPHTFFDLFEFLHVVADDIVLTVQLGCQHLHLLEVAHSVFHVGLGVDKVLDGAETKRNVLLLKRCGGKTYAVSTGLLALCSKRISSVSFYD